MKIALLLIMVCLGMTPSFAKTPDSLLYFSDLSQKVGLKHPKLHSKEYEIRLWVKTALAYGEAQELYVMHQKKNHLTLRRYFLFFQKRQYLKHTVTFTASLRDTSLWNGLMFHDILTLPNGHGIVDEIIKEERQKMNQFKDTTWVTVINDSIQVIGRRPKGKLLLVFDGTSYYVETFTKKAFHKYAYHCPSAYSKAYPQKSEFIKASAIIQLIFRAFMDHDKRICHQSPSNHHRYARLQRGKNAGKSRQLHS